MSPARPIDLPFAQFRIGKYVTENHPDCRRNRPREPPRTSKLEDEAVRQHIETAIANANHVSIYATGYGHTGAHLVHRQGAGQDGAIFIDPLGPKPYVFAFRFASQSF
jgi:hypothetical protein